ncbi:MAG: protoheme IX farnesyltransferase [Gammaproteobacteria bacterium]|nr:protoheme IX farnesyltransferase [Gammaproteobacteria bacterium]
MFSQLVNVFKLRIGALIAITAIAGYVVTPGADLPAWQIVALGLLVLMSSASAGAFNQFVERDLDARMSRTCKRPFVTGAFTDNRLWLWGVSAMLLVSVVAAGWLFNLVAAFHIFMGAFTYAIVYTVWLKRCSVFNIVIGGLAGSFAVLGGAAAADPGLSPAAILLATVLFLWTPPHFWSLAIVLHRDYAAAKVPMLPVVVGDAAAARLILVNTIILVAASITPFFYGLGWVYLSCAVVGGGYFILRNIELVLQPTKEKARVNFFASIIQLSLVLVGAIIDVQLAGWGGV